jgi:hypothetical protein
MVESNEDPEIVTATIVRESVRAQCDNTSAPAAELRVEPPAVASTPAVLAVEVKPAELPPPRDPEASFRHLRLGICGALVVVLFLAWIWQKKSSKD